MWQAILNVLKSIVIQLEGFVGTAIHDLIVYVQAVIPAEEATIINQLAPYAQTIVTDLSTQNFSWSTFGQEAETQLQAQAIGLGIAASITAVKVAIGLAMASKGITANTTDNAGIVS